MNNRTIFALIILLSAFIVAASCNIISTADKAGDTLATAQAGLNEVRAVITQAQGLATQAEESGFHKTAIVLATQVAEQSGTIKGTLEALATKADEQGLRETAVVLGTQLAEQSGSLKETMAVVKEEITTLDTARPDIPFPGTNLNNLFVTKALIIYEIDMQFEDVVVFYQTNLPAMGWNPADGTTITENSAILFFTKVFERSVVSLHRNATNNSTQVMIAIVSG